jgi:hypothetical protein
LRTTGNTIVLKSLTVNRYKIVSQWAAQSSASCLRTDSVCVEVRNVGACMGENVVGILEQVTVAREMVRWCVEFKPLTPCEDYEGLLRSDGVLCSEPATT